MCHFFRGLLLVHNLMLSQNDVTVDFSQNTMPRGRSTSKTTRKRARRASSTPARAALPTTGRIINQGNQWALASPYAYLRTFDPFPSRMSCRLRYSSGVSLSTTGAIATYLFRANSIFDPDYSGIGHQPYGHDTYASIYNKYIVKASYITVSLVSNSTQGMLGISLTDDNTVNGDWNTVRETKGTKYIPLTFTGAPTVTNSFKADYLDPSQKDLMQASFGANPNQVQFYHIWYDSKNPTTESAIDIVVNITYDVDVCELKDLGQS